MEPLSFESQPKSWATGFGWPGLTDPDALFAGWVGVPLLIPSCQTRCRGTFTTN
jgi:hypothetical protein